MSEQPKYPSTAAGKPLRWGILGTGNIARKFATALQSTPPQLCGVVTTVASRSKDTADAFQRDFHLEKSYASYQELLADETVDIVYISLPNHLHATWSLQAAQSGKHILCEKPLTVHRKEAEALFKAIRPYNVCLMEGFLYRCHPQTQKLIQLIATGQIGEVRLIEADFCFDLGLKYDNIRMSEACAGGAIMDVGCYTMSMARLLAGASVGMPFLEPIGLKGMGVVDAKSKVDLWAACNLKFETGLIASLHCATQFQGENTLRVFGSTGSIKVLNPWKPGKQSYIQLTRFQTNATEELEITADWDMFPLQAAYMVSQIKQGHIEAEAPALTWADSLGNMAALDKWRQEIGLNF